MYFHHLDIFKERRKEMLHKKWIQNVAEPLQQRIMEKVISYRGLEKTKQENFKYFLKHANKTVLRILFKIKYNLKSWTNIFIGYADSPKLSFVFKMNSWNCNTEL